MIPDYLEELSLINVFLTKHPTKNPTTLNIQLHQSHLFRFTKNNLLIVLICAGVGWITLHALKRTDL